MTATYGDTVLSILSPEAYKVPTPYGWYAQASWIGNTPLSGTPSEAEASEANDIATHIAVYPYVELGVNAFTESTTAEDVKHLAIAVFQNLNSSEDEPSDTDSYILEGSGNKIPGLVQINDLDIVVEADKLAEALAYIKTMLPIIDPESLNENSKGLLSFGEVIASFDLFADLAGRGRCMNIHQFRDDHAHDKPLRLIKVVDGPEEGSYYIYLLATVSVDNMSLETHFEVHKDAAENEREMARLILSKINFVSSTFLYVDPKDHIKTEEGKTNAFEMLVQKALGN